MASVQGGNMKAVCAAVLAVCLLHPCVYVSAQNTNSAPPSEQEIRTLEDERNRAMLKGDAAALERMTADDYTFITLRGELRTKSEIVKGFRSGSFKYDSRTIPDLKIWNLRRHCDRDWTLNTERLREREGLQRRLPIHQCLREAKGSLGHRCTANANNS
jgi:hypothetical protein